jgi:hypothetical protein
MRVLPESSYCRLTRAESELAELRDRHRALAILYRQLETRHTAVLLEIGLKGYTAEDRPARVAGVVLKKVRG